MAEKKIQAVEEPVITQAPQEPIVIQTVDPEIAKRKEDQDDIKRLNNEFKQFIMQQEKVPFKPPKYYADIVGRIYPFTYNGMTFVVRFDGTTQYFPESIYRYLIKKLGRILDESAPVSEIETIY